ncbi:methyltransferase [Nocardia neocaledoniensis NBRC 108232]|uniref:Methyltransferase family protein n=1 Tax=Nocardia neocaledoniensis TaxID=236511 RepID=A0A317NE18_9NOCA|nr:class I SAM-dependent methyltransferase [Nocardia neocaledoniensis]PWV73429.1 methyltransferase family protein [Nocardia neocaledoniensis]GEM29986.1 methyltransferase [Nocardia neocaledoniensis NBRC 108232]
MTETAPTAEQFWEDFYREHDQVWTGNPNKTLVREVSELTPGTALDLGCGEGGDAIWLAARGWQVTAVDISSTAMARGAEHAAAAGVEITWARHDLHADFPEGTFDLVSAQFLHSPVEQPEERAIILRKAAAAVAPGGVLVVGGHHGWPTWVTTPPHHVDFPTIEQVLDQLALGPEWQVETAELVYSPSTSPEGVEGERADSVLRVRRG